MNTKLRCILLDDELPGLMYMKMLCDQIPNLEVVKSFDNPLTFLKEQSKFEFDFCILDIEMPEMNGLQLANLLGNKPVVFATAYKEYAAEAFDLNAIDYVRKPIKIERLKAAIEKVYNYFLKTENPTAKSYIQLNTDKGKAILFFENLAYIRVSDVDSRDKIAYLFDGEKLLLKNVTFDHLFKFLPTTEFCRINKKEVVSIKSVRLFSFDEITTVLASENGTNLKLSLNEIYRNEFLRKLKV